MPLLKNMSPKKPTATDKDVPYSGTIDSLIKFSSVFGLSCGGSCATLAFPASRKYGMKWKLAV